jgi:hypothetical protein
MNTPKQIKDLVLDETSACEALAHRKKYPDYAEKLLGADILQNITAFAENEHIFELDILKLTGALSIEEADEYRRLLPQYIETEHLITDLAVQIAEKLAEKIPLYVEQGLSNGNITPNNKLVRFFLDLEKIIHTPQVRPHSTFRNGYLSNLYDKVAGILCSMILHLVLESNKYSKDKQNKLAEIYNLLGKLFSQNGSRFSGLELLNQCRLVDKSMSGNLEHFDQFQENNSYKNEPLWKLEEMGTEKFKKIRARLVFRSIDTHYQVLGNTMIEFKKRPGKNCV